MTEQQYGRRAVETGPTGRTAAENLARLRKARGLSTRQLAAALERAGRSVSPSGISRMEKAERHMTVDDLIALAVVLNVNPSALLLPRDDSPATVLELLPGRHVDGGEIRATASRVWEWADGAVPLFSHPDEEKDLDGFLDFIGHARPPRRGRREMAMALRDETEGDDGPSVD